MNAGQARGEHDATSPGTEAVVEAALTEEERILGAPRTLRGPDVAAKAGVSTFSARRFWRALGLPVVEPEQRAFTESDVQALQAVSALVRDGVLDDQLALALTRAVGRSVDRMASWQVQLLGEEFADAAADLAAQSGQMGDGSAADAAVEAAVGRVAELAPDFADGFEALIVYAWRRHLASAMRRFVTETSPDNSVPMLRRSVCFADLVSFTRLVRRLPERELSGVVQRFESITSDAITSAGGRVIKTVGDEVLFVAWPPEVAVEAALSIAMQIGADPMLPDVRVGIATGEVLARLGDVYGATVNLASRMTSLAQPGHVICDEVTAQALEDDERITCTPLRRRSVKGLGQVTPWLVTWASQEPRHRWRLSLPGLG
ncbi:MAG: adenylate/guanylate cyclase domain-containing protein [Actinomycetales bacterium]